MKIRQGFVSNSSSSSFIVDTNKYTVKELAINMAKTMYEIYDSELIQKIKNMSEDILCIILDYSDDSQIVKEGNKLYVQCTYHIDDWNFDYISCHEEEEFYEKFDEKYKNYQSYYPEYNIFGKKCYMGYSNCNQPDCNGETFKIKSGEIICGKCWKDENGKYPKHLGRKYKLNRILK